MNVGVECVFPLVLTELVDITGHHLIGVIIEQNVDGTHFAQCLFNYFLAIVLVFQVRGVEMALRAVLLRIAFGLLGIFLFIRQVGNEAIRALHCEKNGSGSPYSTDRQH